MSKKNILNTSVFLTLVIAIMLTFTIPAIADKPSWAGNNKGNSSKNSKKNKDKNNSSSKDKYSDSINLNIYFNNEQRKIIQSYYQKEYRRGHCPPGLAKKNNGCMPPGQVKRWKKGVPLSWDVVHYDLPSDLVVQLGKPPEGNRYVRVANDILLMAVGTRMIVDAIEDLGEL